MKRYSVAQRSTSPSSSSDSSPTGSPRKRLRSTCDDNSTSKEQIPLKVFLVQEKLSEQEVQKLFDLIESTQTSSTGPNDSNGHLYLESCNEPEDAHIIVTNIRMKKRLQRHVNWNVAKQKSIVTPQWIIDSVKEHSPVQCGHYAALSELHDETMKHCPNEDEQQMNNHGPSLSFSFLPSPSLSTPTVKPTDLHVTKNWMSRYACTRASPLLCVNQALAAELGVLGRSRELEGQSINALSYERSVAVIKSYPYLITNETYSRDIVRLPGLGHKTLSKIREFINNGYIEESSSTRRSERYQTLSEFAKIYGIGPSNARKLYDLGLRSMEDLDRYYDVTIDSTVPSLEGPLVTPNRRKIMTRNKIPDMTIQISLTLRHDFEIPITQEEVEEMHRVVMVELDKIQPGCISTIVGGYRRGKPQSNDVDIVFSYPDLREGAAIIKGVCTKFTKHLYDCGLVTHCMHLSGFHAHDALRAGHWDSLEKALTVFKLPNTGGGGEKKRLHRRLDLIFAAPEAYWTTVVGWSGSKMFERDLRLWAKVEKGMKFDSSGMTRRHDSKLFIPRSEEEVFSILGLDWVDPTMRNADV